MSGSPSPRPSAPCSWASRAAATGHRPRISTFFGGDDSSWASPVDQHVDFAEFTLTEGSAPPPGEQPASDEDGDLRHPGRIMTTGVTAPVQTRG